MTRPVHEGLLRQAQAAQAFRTSSDLPALIEVFGESLLEGLAGTAWRFFLLDRESGALRNAGASGGNEVHLPMPGGAIEWILEHEALLLAHAGDFAGPSLEPSLWTESPELLVGLPLRGGGSLHGLILVSRKAPPPSAEALIGAQALADQFSLVLDREMALHELELAQERMRRLEVKANAGEELLSQLIAVVAHEIRTPLTSIKAYTESLIDAPSTEFEQRREFLTVINDECDRLARLISDALDLSRLEARQRAIRMRPCDPRILLQDVAATLEPETTKNALALVTHARPNLKELEADPDLLKQLLLNLVGNAIKFSPRGSTVTVEAAAKGADWEIAVIDQGGGIPDEQLDRVFERFYRVPQKDGRLVAGTGLGLAIARHIVELHGGTIRAENAPTGGSIFTVCLPRRHLAPARIRQVSGALTARRDVRGLLDDAVRTIGEVMQAEIVSILLVDPDQGDLFVAAARGLELNARTARQHYRGGVAGAAVAEGRALLINNIETDKRFARRSHPQYFTKSLLCAPISVGGQAIGVVNVNNKASHTDFDAQDLTILAGLVEHLAAALNRAYAYPGAPTILAEARVAMRSVARVKRDLLLGRGGLARCAEAMAARLGLDANTCALVGRLAWEIGPTLDSSGKPKATAERPALSPQSAAQSHALLAARSERPDGTGYPVGLTGDAIPMGARILAVLDEFESLTRGRSYRTALSVDDALASLARSGGRRFDPRVVQALSEVLTDQGWASRHGEAA